MVYRSDLPAITVKNVSKEFKIPHEKRTTLFENIAGAFKPSSYEKFVALEDVSFIVNKGDSLGIIGDNGSGKSTLLKIISGILKPTTGRVEVNGKITPFLELGVGFQPDLTAKENIEVYSTIMGLSEKEISKNMDSVLEFTGLTKFRDTKLKNFSSGMQVRLAFATAIQRTPEIVLVDEVLAVGDMEFQRKCFDIFQQYADSKVTMVFVSHDLNSVRRFCDKTLLLNRGKAVAYGDTNEVIDRYIYKMNVGQTTTTSMSNGEQTELNNTSDMGNIVQGNTPVLDSVECVAEYRKRRNFRWGNKKLEITGIKVMDKNDNEGDSFVSGDPMTIILEYVINGDVKRPVFGFDITNEKGENCFGSNTILKGVQTKNIKNKGFVKILIKELPLLQGRYFLSVASQSDDYSVTYDWHSKTHSFYVVNKSGEEGFIRFKYDFLINS